MLGRRVRSRKWKHQQFGGRHHLVLINAGLECNPQLINGRSKHHGLIRVHGRFFWRINICRVIIICQPLL